MKQQDIWNPETGITDLSERDRNAPSTIVRKEHFWDAEQLHHSYEIRNTIASIETGHIEGVYQVPASGVTISHLTGVVEYPDLAVETYEIIDDQKDVLKEAFKIAGQRRPITLHLIKELHQHLTRHQDDIEAIDAYTKRRVRIPLLKGEWKKHPNNPSRGSITFGYCPPVQVQSEMEKLLDIHATHEHQGVHGEVAAAWLHHRFTQIHPFQDGNGRMARILASIVLLKSGLLPLTVLRQHRGWYLDALEYADKTDLKELVDFIECAQVDYLQANLPKDN